MWESQQTYIIIAIAVVTIGLTILGYFVFEGVTTANIYKQGVKLYQEKNYQAAQGAFERAISRHPSNDVARLLLGDTLMQQDKTQEAIATWQELINRAPKNADARIRLAMALVKQNHLPDAIASLKAAQELYTAQRNPQKAENIARLIQEISQQQSLT